MSTLTIVIPALNEEEAIGSTIERCLAAHAQICRTADVDEVEIIVVSDGSTDRTAQIAKGYAQVKVIVFPKNRGYGAAIKEGWRQGTGELLAFLDADGTCDPLWFGQLCRALKAQSADISLGSRMGPDSKMPPLRRLGNRIYAFLLGMLCGQSVTDTASGMRVVRRSKLSELYPLPDGLHFTPAMSARALLGGLRIAELPMPYAERVGRSKLSVVRDGIRFFKCIFDGVLCFRPERLFLLAFAVCLLLTIGLAAFPTEFYLREGRLEEWMIYRFIVCFLFGTVSFTLLAAGTVAHKLATATNRRRVVPRFWPTLFESLFSGRPLAILVVSGLLIAGALVWPGILEYVGTGHLSLHWSRVMIAAFGLLVVCIASVTAVLLRVVEARDRHEVVGVADLGPIPDMRLDIEDLEVSAVR